MQGVTRKATRHIFKARTAARRNASKLAWSDRLILLSHTFTDVGSWPRLQKYSKVLFHTAYLSRIHFDLPTVSAENPDRFGYPVAQAALFSFRECIEAFQCSLLISLGFAHVQL